MLTGMGHSPRWLPKQKTCQCPKWFTWCNRLLGNQHLHRPELCTLAWCLGPSKGTNTAHKAWGIMLLSPPSKAPVSGTSCPALCCLNREFTPVMWRGDEPMKATSNLIMWQPKTSYRLDWPHLQLWWCRQTQTLQLPHSTSYNWNHNLIPKSVTNGPALLLKFINCLNPPEMENSEC